MGIFKGLQRAPWKGVAGRCVCLCVCVNGHRLWEGRTSEGNCRGKNGSGSLTESPRKLSAPSWAVPLPWPLDSDLPSLPRAGRAY